MKTKFHHLRNVDQQGRISPNGGSTIAYVVDDDFNVTMLAAAKCHAKDTYCKQEGRVKAAGRLKSPRYLVELSPPKPEKEFITTLTEEWKQHKAAY